MKYLITFKIDDYGNLVNKRVVECKLKHIVKEFNSREELLEYLKPLREYVIGVRRLGE